MRKLLDWVKDSIEDIDKVPGYGMVLLRFIKALRKHAPKTPEAVGEIYMEIPQRIIWDLQTEEDDIVKTVQILYNDSHKETADAICERFAEAGVLFLRSVREEHQT